MAAEGDQYMSLAITPTNAPNRLRIIAQFIGSNSAANVRYAGALFQDSTQAAIAAGMYGIGGSTAGAIGILDYEMAAGTTSATTFAVRLGSIAGATFTFNGENAARLFGGICNSYMRIEEIFV